MCNSKNQYPELFYFKRMENRERFGKPETYSFCGELPPFFVLKEITLFPTLSLRPPWITYLLTYLLMWCWVIILNSLTLKISFNRAPIWCKLQIVWWYEVKHIEQFFFANQKWCQLFSLSPFALRSDMM